MVAATPFTNSFTARNFRIWCGLFESSPAASNTAPANSAGFFINAGNGNWQTVTADGSATQEVTDTGLTVASNTFYVLQVDCSTNGQVRFLIDGTLVATHTTDLPSGATDLYYHAIMARKNTGGTFDPRFGVGKVFITP